MPDTSALESFTCVKDLGGVKAGEKGVFFGRESDDGCILTLYFRVSDGRLFDLTVFYIPYSPDQFALASSHFKQKKPST